MKRIMILVLLCWSSVCWAETITISGIPDTLPRNIGLGSYSPMIEISYEGLTAQKYTLKIWLLNRGPWYCASGQWCDVPYLIDNSQGTSPNGKIQIVKNMDVYDYGNMDWVARLYNEAGAQVTWDEFYINGNGNRPPVLAFTPDQYSMAGGSVAFQALATDPEGDTVTFSASNLPAGAVMSTDGAFSWPMALEGEYRLAVHADDGQTYDSQEVNMIIGAVEAPEIVITDYPPCGSTAQLEGVVSNAENLQDYAVTAYIFVGGYGWVIKPTAASPKTPILEDGTFEINLTTGTMDDLAEIILVGVVKSDAHIPIVTGGDLPDNIPFLASVKQKRDVSPCHRNIRWSGVDWWVKTSRGGRLGPGGNVFGDTPENVFVDEQGNLHLKIIYDDGVWKCPEIVSLDTFGYGRYEFELETFPVLDPNIVFGFFTWENGVPLEYNREIDIEFSQWGDSSAPNAQYVVQPWQLETNIERFDLDSIPGTSFHRFDWQPESIHFQSISCRKDDVEPENMLADWLYTGSNIPATSEEKVRLNLWIMDGHSSPSDGQEQEVVIKRFRHYVSGSLTGDMDGDGDSDGKDLAAISDAFGSMAGDSRFYPDADLTADGKVDAKDLKSFLQDFGGLIGCGK